jgi:hypothetical protein
MSPETSNVPHMSGLWLLTYVRNHKININELDFGAVPQPLLERHSQSNSVGLVVHLLLEDKQGEKVRQFAEVCPPYKNARTSRDVNRLRTSFQDFVKKVLLSEKQEPVSKSKNNGKEAVWIIDIQLQKLDENHDQIDDWLDTWSEKYDELLPRITEYLWLLEEEYMDPKPESWQRDDDDDDLGFSLSDNDMGEYVPNHHLDCLSRILEMFEAKIAVSDKKIRRLRWKEEEQKYHLGVIKMARSILISLRSIPWEVLGKYPYDNSILFRTESLINSINAVLEENKEEK